jgi:hypothetical protein
MEEMGAAASKNGVSIGYGTPAGPADVLAALTAPSVTFFFASPNPNTPKDRNLNWRISRTALLLNAVGLVPMKDTFWTSVNEPQCQYPGLEFPTPALHAAMATLSNGPVWIGDQVGQLNGTLARLMCRNDGLILRPNAPCTAVDAMLNFTGGGEICATFATTAADFVAGATGYAMGETPGWIYILWADTPSDVHVRMGVDVPGDPAQAYVAVTDGSAAPVAVAPGEAWTLPALRARSANVSDYNRTLSWRMTRLAPRLDKFALLGEMRLDAGASKFVAVSRQRVLNITVTDDAFQATCALAPQEPPVAITIMCDDKVGESLCTSNATEAATRVVRCDSSCRCSCSSE